MDTLKGFIMETVGLFNAMSPYLLFGFLVAGMLKVFLKGDFIVRHLGTHDLAAVVKASIFGIPLPLCSCGVIPTALSLRKQGASKASVFSFMISTPTTGVDSILATYSLLGGFFAVFRVLATFLVALFVGVAGLLIKDDKAKGEKCAEGHCCCSKQKQPVAAEEKPSCCAHKKPLLAGRIVEALKYGFYDLLKDSGRPILIGILIGGAISYFVPTSVVETYLGNVWLSMIIMTLIGVPMYVCSTGSIPIVAALMMKGLNPGAAFVFLITGPAVNSVSFSVISREFGVRSAIWFLVTLVAGSLLMGVVFNWVWSLWGMDFASLVHHHQHQSGIPAWINYASSLILLGCILLSWKKS